MRMNKKLITMLSAVVLIIALILSLSSVASAENVVVEEYNNPNLTFIRIHGDSDDHEPVWKSEGYEVQDPTKGKYKIYTNAYCAWWKADAVDFLYQKIDYSYGPTGLLSVETELTSWNATMSENAGAGIIVRQSLDPDSASLMLHCRPGHIYLIYRAGKSTVTSVAKSMVGAPAYPVGMKVEITGNKAICYLKQKGQKDFSKFATIPFIVGGEIYAGLAAYTVAQAEMACADFTGFKASLTVPEGTEKVDPDSSSSGGGDTSSEVTSSEDKLVVEDPALQPNVLMRETFTDGNIAPEEESYPDNVIWDYNKDFPLTVVTTEDKTNRYLYNWMDSSAFAIAGDQHWTDYTTTVDLTFNSDYSEEGKNHFYVLVRHRDISMYGAHDYAICFTLSKGVPKVSIGRRNSTSTQYADATLIDAKGAKDDILSTEYDWLPKTGEKSATLKITAFDNVITAWIDGEKVIQYTDTTTAVNGYGSIGFVFKEVAVKVDNIIVTEEIDLLGGEYDNEICGNWNEDIPELVQHFADEKYKGYTDYSFTPKEEK